MSDERLQLLIPDTYSPPRVFRGRAREGVRAGVTVNCGERRRTLTPTLSLSTGRGGKGQLLHEDELDPVRAGARAFRQAPSPTLPREYRGRGKEGQWDRGGRGE
jgi:hypothetical protein